MHLEQPRTGCNFLAISCILHYRKSSSGRRLESMFVSSHSYYEHVVIYSSLDSFCATCFVSYAFMLCSCCIAPTLCRNL